MQEASPFLGHGQYILSSYQPHTGHLILVIQYPALMRAEVTCALMLLSKAHIIHALLVTGRCYATMGPFRMERFGTLAWTN